MPQKSNCFHTSSRIAAQTVVESFCSSSTSSAKTPLLRFFLYSERAHETRSAIFLGVVRRIYILGIIDFDFRLLWKQQTTGRSKISSTRSPSRTFSGILLLPPPLRRRNQSRSTIFFSDAFSSCRDVEWTSPFAKKNAPMMMHR